jgi:hypothetical protein
MARKIRCPRKELTREQREGRVWYRGLARHNYRVLTSGKPPEPPPSLPHSR